MGRIVFQAAMALIELAIAVFVYYCGAHPAGILAGLVLGIGTCNLIRDILFHRQLKQMDSAMDHFRRMALLMQNAAEHAGRIQSAQEIRSRRFDGTMN